ncbi:MAG: ribonuclease E inhibitor RraB [Proteobacteria bacterium]|nr:ribonuclease E inhibitor RraB [Pseudomonadota bacterium]
MNWTVALLILAALISLARIVSQLRTTLKPKKDDDWDSRFIEQLRKMGFAPFDPYPVDFFFDLPDEQACREVTEELEPEQFVIDSRYEPDTERWSLHAHRTLRLQVEQMQAFTIRFNAMAQSRGGRYDGWAIGK